MENPYSVLKKYTILFEFSLHPIHWFPSFTHVTLRGEFTRAPATSFVPFSEKIWVEQLLDQIDIVRKLLICICMNMYVASERSVSIPIQICVISNHFCHLLVNSELSQFITVSFVGSYKRSNIRNKSKENIFRNADSFLFQSHPLDRFT